ncbi:MAG: hypothetical protein U5J99_13590 [Parvularculaceae bacterium]|nr:hypothetical protein [Parvularculaceae bacterium]
MRKVFSLFFAAAITGAALLFAGALAGSGGDVEHGLKRACAESLCGVVFF